MIELRWLDRVLAPGYVRSDGHQHGVAVEPKVERALQYRVKDDWGGHNDEADWGNWQDVPVERLP